jgi:hypothetical protein
MVLVFLYTTLHERGWQPIWLVVLTGAVAGTTALLSPMVLPVIAGLLGIELLQSESRGRLFLKMGTLLVVAGLCIAPWTYRNYRVMGGFVPIRSNFGLELSVGNNPHANGRTFATYACDPQCPNFYGHPYRSRDALARIREVGELAFMKEKQAETVAWIAAHPARFVELTLARFRYFWFPPAAMFNASSPEVSALLEFKAVLVGLLSLGCFGWLAFAIWRGEPSRWVWVVLVFAPSLSYMITHVDLRYRYPIFGFTVLLCCHFVFEFLSPLAIRMFTLASRWKARVMGTHPFAGASDIAP